MISQNWIGEFGDPFHDVILINRILKAFKSTIFTHNKLHTFSLTKIHIYLFIRKNVVAPKGQPVTNCFQSFSNQS